MQHGKFSRQRVQVPTPFLPQQAAEIRQLLQSNNIRFLCRAADTRHLQATAEDCGTHIRNQQCLHRLP